MPPARLDSQALGTTATVMVTDERRLAEVAGAVGEVLDAVDAACSRFRADSELVRLNAHAGRPTVVGELLLDAILVALRAAALTDGAVDPTVGMALRRAGHDEAFGAVVAPVRVTRATWRDVHVDIRRRCVRLPAGAELDLGATAKALAADRAAIRAAGRAHGASVLVSLGGDLAIAGPPPDRGWRVRVAEDHRAAADAPGQTVLLSGGGLATSTTTVRRWGAGAHHIIDPATQRPAHGPWRTATVAAASCVDANIASTAAIVHGPHAVGRLERAALPARLVAEDGRVVRTAGWPT